jgi:ubiquinone/menaquinone biosynthesis C-methylase UbiE
MEEQCENIKKCYDNISNEEWMRLDVSFPYEKYITTHMINKYLKPGDSILDIGGGPGHYSVYYAKQGYSVTLFDLSDGNIKFAKEKAKQNSVEIKTIQGNALDLSKLKDNSFDVVFLMGPLYHLMNEENRIKAIKEAKRVLKEGGFLFCSFILMFNIVISGLRDIKEKDLMKKEPKWFDFAAKGESACVEDKDFTFVYMTTINDVKKLFSSIPGLKKATIFGQESILAPYRNIIQKCPEEQRIKIYDYALNFCEKEEYLSHAERLMYVAKKIG